MYKYLGIGLLGIFTMMLIPAQGQDVPAGFNFYGIANLVVYDAYGNELLRHNTHNVVVNDGEVFVIEQVFAEGSTPTTTATIGSMCITGTSSFAPVEGTDAAALDGDVVINEVTRCHGVAFVNANDGSVDNSVAPETFTQTDTGGAVAITGIGICQDNGGAGATFQDCDFTGGGANILFAAVVISPSVTLAAGETVDIDYSFSIA